MSSLTNYLRETSQEMKRVSWPARAQLWESTVVVIVTVTIITILLFIVDKILDSAVKFIINLG
jgi:preprotein translocase subunit SecE